MSINGSSNEYRQKIANAFPNLADEVLTNRLWDTGWFLGAQIYLNKNASSGGYVWINNFQYK